jgi:CheY-like chemotaxis protein
MSNYSSPRLLVVDDDLGVIAAYRHVLEGDELSRGLPSSLEENALEDELFGTSGAGNNLEDNWRVDFVDQGDDAVAAVRAAVAASDPYSAVFLDIRMPPGMDGYDAAKLIRAIDPNVHVVFVSAYSDYTQDELSAAAKPMHRTSFLSKPVWPAQLKATALAICREVQLLALLRASKQERVAMLKTGT